MKNTKKFRIKNNKKTKKRRRKIYNLYAGSDADVGAKLSETFKDNLFDFFNKAFGFIKKIDEIIKFLIKCQCLMDSTKSNESSKIKSAKKIIPDLKNDLLKIKKCLTDINSQYKRYTKSEDEFLKKATFELYKISTFRLTSLSLKDLLEHYYNFFKKLNLVEILDDLKDLNKSHKGGSHTNTVKQPKPPSHSPPKIPLPPPINELLKTKKKIPPPPPLNELLKTKKKISPKRRSKSKRRTISESNHTPSDTLSFDKELEDYLIVNKIITLDEVKNLKAYKKTLRKLERADKTLFENIVIDVYNILKICLIINKFLSLSLI